MKAGVRMLINTNAVVKKRAVPQNSLFLLLVIIKNDNKYYILCIKAQNSTYRTFIANQRRPLMLS